MQATAMRLPGMLCNAVKELPPHPFHPYLSICAQRLSLALFFALRALICRDYAVKIHHLVVMWKKHN